MKGVDDSRSALAKLERGTDRLLAAAGFTRAEFAAPVAQEVQTSWGRFAKSWEVLQDDLNIPGCLGQVFTVLAEKDEPTAEQARQDVSGLAKILFALGLQLFAVKAEVAIPAEVAELGARRWAAKQSKDFAAADQLRKDLAYFGTFGTRGLGYDVEQLGAMIADVLGTNRLQPVILVGVGNLGAALLAYQGFGPEGFEVVAAFDAEPAKARTRTPFPRILPMVDMARIIRERRVRMAILTVPVTSAQEVVNQLVEAGIVGVLNFAPIGLQVPEDVTVNGVNLAIELENLSYFIQD